MKLDELMAELQDLKDSGVSGDTQVLVRTGHNHVKSLCVGAYTSHIRHNDYYRESIHPDDLEDYPDAIKVVEIYG